MDVCVCLCVFCVWIGYILWYMRLHNSVWIHTALHSWHGDNNESHTHIEIDLLINPSYFVVCDHTSKIFITQTIAGGDGGGGGGGCFVVYEYMHDFGCFTNCVYLMRYNVSGELVTMNACMCVSLCVCRLCFVQMFAQCAYHFISFDIIYLKLFYAWWRCEFNKYTMPLTTRARYRSMPHCCFACAMEMCCVCVCQTCNMIRWFAACGVSPSVGIRSSYHFGGY